MKIEMYGEKVSAVDITTKSSAFTGESWKDAYFRLLSWKNTWGIPYRMDIMSYNDGEAYLYMIVKKVSEERVIDMLQDLGYGDIKTEDITLCVLEPDLEDNIDDYVIG